MYDYAQTNDNYIYSRQPDTPEDNADPVGLTTTKGLLLWWFDAVFKLSSGSH